MLLSQTWLSGHAERWRSAALSLDEPIRIALWDCFLIWVKLRRALGGQDEFLKGNELDDDPVQNDWNGSAKVALISIVRSALAWSAIAEVTADPEAAQIAAELHSLQDEVERVFPDAWQFVRPGFDTLPHGGAD